MFNNDTVEVIDCGDDDFSDLEMFNDLFLAPELTEYVEHVVEYIAGYIVVKISKKLN